MTYGNRITAGLILALILAAVGGAQTKPSGPATQNANARPEPSPKSPAWESPARLGHGIGGGKAGTLRIDSQGIEFVPSTGATRRWTLIQIKDLDLQSHRVVLVGYDNRGWGRPGTQRFDWELQNEITPAIASSLTEEMRRPVRNRLPDPDGPAIVVIAVRRSELFDGSNGSLRIRQQGIDYVTAQADQNRSWRWVDLKTLSNPDPYHLLVFGYRDSYSFELKETLPRELFNHLSDEIWTHNESETRGSRMTWPPGALTNGVRRDDE
jgi:hypothetical protein